MKRVGRRRLATIALLAVLGLAGCATAAEPSPPPDPDPTAPPAPIDAESDPLEGFNRGIFWFDDHLDRYLLEPVAIGWNWAVPDAVQHAISNFFANLRTPIVTANDLLQGKGEAAAIELGRFAVNSTAGIAGFLDPAEPWFCWEKQDEDFGQTLGRWGVGPGPYLVLPFLGPSNPRDVAGLLVDYPASILPFFVNSFVLIGTGATELVNQRSLDLEPVRTARAAALDYYVLVRNAYSQRRQALIEDSHEIHADDSSGLYFPAIESPAAPSSDATP